MAKHISELTTPATPSRYEQPSISYDEQSKENIKEIFLLMKANYGHKWTSNLKEPEELKIAARLWLFHFHSQKRECLHKALSYCFLKYDWPPTVKEFRAELKLVVREAEMLDRLRLPPPVVAPGIGRVAQEHIEKLKKIVGLS